MRGFRGLVHSLTSLSRGGLPLGHDLVEGHKYRHIYYERVQGVGSFVDLAISGWPAPRA